MCMTVYCTICNRYCVTIPLFNAAYLEVFIQLFTKYSVVINVGQYSVEREENWWIVNWRANRMGLPSSTFWYYSGVGGGEGGGQKKITRNLSQNCRFHDLYRTVESVDKHNLNQHKYKELLQYVLLIKILCNFFQVVNLWILCVLE